jgi:hypothetical protein
MATSVVPEVISRLKPPNWANGSVDQARIEPDVVSELLAAVKTRLHASAESTIERSAISFITPDGLTYPASVQQITELSQSSTTVLQKLESSQGLFGAIARALQSSAHPRVTLSAYLSSTRSHKLGMHQDKWDNIVIQLSGEKTFFFVDAPPKLLSAGDVLFLPQDVRHDVETASTSVHLSIALLREKWMKAEGWHLNFDVKSA